MSSPDSPPSGCTSFEQELVSAMNDFVNSTRTPHFDTATIARGARRKRATAIAGIATALVVAGAGTALAVGAVGSGSDTARLYCRDHRRRRRHHLARPHQRRWDHHGAAGRGECGEGQGDARPFRPHAHVHPGPEGGLPEAGGRGGLALAACPDGRPRR